MNLLTEIPKGDSHLCDTINCKMETKQICS